MKSSLLIFVICASCTGFSQNLKQSASQYVYGKRDSVTISFIYETGKEVIPVLIDLIDIDKKGMPGFSNQFSSNIDLSKKYLGMNAAFMIELILSTDKDYLPLIRYQGTSLVTPVDGISSGIIINKISLKPLSKDDMKEIKEKYLQWWDLNKNYSLEKIRIKWKAGDRPLSDSNYLWE